MRLDHQHTPDQESTFPVKRTSPHPRTITVTADGKGIVSHAGAAALRQLADRLGFSQVASMGLRTVRQRRGRHDPGAVLTDLVVSIADGGDCLSDLAALRDQPRLFGQVASTATVWRLVDAIGERELGRLADARRQARARAWRAAGAPEQIVLDIDATLVTSHSEKELAKGNFKGGFGFYPLACYLEATGEALAAILRPGNAGSNTARDHITVLERALHQLPDQAWEGDILVRCDTAGASHDLLDAVHELELQFSVGFEMNEAVRTAILGMGELGWRAAIRQNGSEREGAQVCELTSLDLSTWPPGTRAICRRERPHPGAQLTFTDHNGWRFQVFITNQQEQDIALLEARHRARARCEDWIRCAKDTGLRAFPFKRFRHNQVWLELVLAAHDLLCHFRRVGLDGQARLWEPSTLRYRLLHSAARLVSSSRRLILRLQLDWPWSRLLASAFQRIQRLQAT
jgi:hypothetical protein